MEKLAIFGNQRARRGAQLKVMAAVETKVPSYFTRDLEVGDDGNPEGFGTHTLVLKVMATMSRASHDELPTTSPSKCHVAMFSDAMPPNACGAFAGISEHCVRFSLAILRDNCAQPDELSYALGKKGMTRKKLARSSGCIVEYVGYHVFMSGMPDERKRAQEYLGWLFEQLRGPVYVEGWEVSDPPS